MSSSESLADISFDSKSLFSFLVEQLFEEDVDADEFLLDEIDLDVLVVEFASLASEYTFELKQTCFFLYFALLFLNQTFQKFN